MYLSEYQKVSIDNFMGLWNRGSLDDIPPDHASDIRNMAFARKREVLTRPSADFSDTFEGGIAVRQFLAAFNNDTLIPLVCDGVGNIWRLDSHTKLLTVQGMIDFDAINMNNAVYIAPMVIPQDWNATTDIIYVWSRPDFPVRPAAGLPPVAAPGMTVFPVNTGNVGPGWYGVAIAYVYDTGYVTPPSDVVTANMPGGTAMEIAGMPGHFPNNPNGVVGYLLFVTQAQATQQLAQTAALYELQTVDNLGGGPSTAIEVNFFDTDLVILASNDPANGNLFNSMPLLPSGGGYGSVALMKYHGRLIIIGPNITYNPTNGNTTEVQDGRIFVSHPGAPENFDILTGYLVANSEFDGNLFRTGFELFGVLYLCKAVGTFATNDTGSDPNDPTNPWVVNMIDGGIGAYHHAVGTITASQPSLSFNSTAFLANRNGLFLFNGNVQRPELTWKIRYLWQEMTIGAEYAIRVAVDIFNDLFYCMIPTGNPVLGPLLILIGDYSLGLDSQNIRWSIYTFPWPVYDIVMANENDANIDPIKYYYLRLGSNGAIYRLSGENTFDTIWNGASNPPTEAIINNYYQSAPLIVGDVGSLNITRYVRYRMAGAPNSQLTTLLMDQAGDMFQKFATVVPDPFPLNYRDLGIQTNFINEKVIVQFGMNALTDYFRMARFDVFGKVRWPKRPNA